MQRRVLLFVVPLLTVAIVALGLRTGAKDEVEAGIVRGAPLPRGGEHVAWMLATFREASGVREVWSTPFVATFRGKGEPVVVRGTTNEDGAAELDATIPGLAEGDPLELEVKTPDGNVLAAGKVTWAVVHREEGRVLVHPTVREGDLDVTVSVWGARLATAHEGLLWVRADDHVTGKPAHLVRGEVESEPSLGVVDGFRAVCSDLAGTLRVVPNIHVAWLDLKLTDDHGRTGRFYGSLPIAPGALSIDAPTRVAAGPVSFSVTAPNAHKIAYLEIDDEVGRLHGSVVDLGSDARDPFPHATVTTPPLAPGLHWIVVSSEPDAAETLAGATRAFPLRVGVPVGDACDEPFSGRTPSALPRFVALDGFARARIPAQARKASGRKIILGAVTVGLGLELLLVVAALRRKPILDPEAKAPPRSRAFDAVVLLFMSALGFLLLFALLESQTR